MPRRAMWEPSPSPVELWNDAEGANENGEWPIKGIVGEEIRLDRSSRYEVRWDNWHRPDKSNTTWEAEKSFDNVKLIKQWQRKQKRLRKSLAERSCDMDVPWPDNALHKRLTDQYKQAYTEKKEKKRREGSISTADWDEEIEKALARIREPERGESNSKLRVRRGPSLSSATSVRSLSNKRRPSPSRDNTFFSGPTPKRDRGRPRTVCSPASSRSPSTTHSAFSYKGKRLTMTPSSASVGSSKEIEALQNSLPSVVIRQPTLRGRVSSTWNKAANEAMAAMVRISPDISDADFPHHLRKFKYIEKGYVFRDESVKKKFDVHRSIFTSCDECFTCSDASSCNCRDFSQIYNFIGKKNFLAYSEGLFTFEVPRGVDVIECNKYCMCDNDCGNRVVQRPRDIGIEIFDTKRCGWGVRAMEDIPRGKVLGTYTGMLVYVCRVPDLGLRLDNISSRDEVDELPKEHQEYCFDLDSTEEKNLDNPSEKYTVDSYEYGNWTRFVNHSCSPNMQVYCVVYDTIPNMNMPYVAFVASTDILAGTELTIDYCPYAKIDRKGKRAAKGDCKCGSAECRGWIKS